MFTRTSFIFCREVETTDPKAPLADEEEEEEIGDPVPVILKNNAFKSTNHFHHTIIGAMSTGKCPSCSVIMRNCGSYHGGDGTCLLRMGDCS